MRQRGPSPDKLIASLRNQVARRAAEEQRQVVERLVRACFRGQHEPDGTPWPRRADGSGRPLLLTLKDDLSFIVNRSPGTLGQVLVDTPNKPHAEFQAHGTVYIPARPWAPEPGQPLPPEWQRAVQERLQATFRRAWEAARS